MGNKELLFFIIKRVGHMTKIKHPNKSFSPRFVDYFGSIFTIQ